MIQIRKPKHRTSPNITKIFLINDSIGRSTFNSNKKYRLNFKVLSTMPPHRHRGVGTLLQTTKRAGPSVHSANPLALHKTNLLFQTDVLPFTLNLVTQNDI